MSSSRAGSIGSSVSRSRGSGGSLDRGSVSVKTVNFIIIGPPSVGKTCLLGRFCDRKAPTNPQATLGVDFKSRDVETSGERVRLTIWDTAGQDHRRLLADSFYRRAQGVLLCYDITDAQSLETLTGFIDEMRMKCPPGHVAVLVGNKLDLEKDRQISQVDAETFQRRHGLQFCYETSARDGRHVDETFLALTDHCLFTMSTAKRLRKNDKCELCSQEKATRICSTCHQVFCDDCQATPHDPLDAGNIHRASELLTEEFIRGNDPVRGSLLSGGGNNSTTSSRFVDRGAGVGGLGQRSRQRQEKKKGCPCKS